MEKTNNLNELKLVLLEKGLLNKRIPFETRYALATHDLVVLEMLDLKMPQISDLSDVMNIKGGGKVYAIRMDLNETVDNHKKFVVAGLILRSVLGGRIPNNKIDTLIDAGNFNSAKAVKYYCERFGMKGIYIMSHLFPKHITDILESENFQVIRAPHKYPAMREREFYEFLYSEMKKEKFRENKCCLWHAKNGGKAGYPFGIEIAKTISFPVDCTVSCLGAGSTLEGIQIPIQDFFKENRKRAPSIVVGEHELSPLFVKFMKPRQVSRDLLPINNNNKDKFLHIEGIPQVAIGPHYDEINPLLSRDSIKRINAIIQYSDDDWQGVQSCLAECGLSVGNSSAANLSVAWRLANDGKKVLTIIFEPFRQFLLKQ